MIAPGSASPPALRIHIRRKLIQGIVSREALSAGSLDSIATIRLVNAVFQPAGGLEISCRGGVIISFPGPGTLQIAVQPRSHRLIQGSPAAVFAPTLIVLSNLGVELNSPAVLIVGEMNHTRLLGELSLSVEGGADHSLLPASESSCPFALGIPSSKN